MTKKLSPEFNRKKIVFGVPSKPYETFRKSNEENLEINGDRSQKDRHHEVGVSLTQSSQEFSPNETSYMVTGILEKILNCSRETSSGKRKKTRFTSEPQFWRENTPATIEDQKILMTLQQLASNSNSTNFNNNFHRILKLRMSLTTTIPTFCRNFEKIELLEDLFQRSLKIYNQLTEDGRRNCFCFLIRSDTLQTFKNINSPTHEILEIVTVLSRNCVKPQSKVGAKQKFQKPVFNPANQNLLNIPDELQNRAKTLSQWLLTPSLNNFFKCQSAATPEEINETGAV